MPKFLTPDELYRIIQRELPSDAYADGSPSAFFTTADNYAAAEVFGSIYLNLSRIYENNYPQTTDERIDDWEITVFGEISASGATLQARRDRVIGKLREQPDLSLWRIQTAILEYLPVGTPVQIIQRYFYFDAWRLGVSGASELGFTTFLSGGERIGPEGAPVGGFCQTPDTEEWRYQRDTAYGFDVRIFGYTMPPLLQQQVDRLIRQIEPARSDYTLFQGLDINDYHLTEVVTPVSKADLFDCIFKNPASSTGYSGRRIPTL